MGNDGITITDSAAEGILAQLAAAGEVPASAGLRIDVVDGGCSGYQYRLALDDTREGDRLFEASGAKVLVAGEALPFVRGARLTYDEAAGGFHVENPNVVYGCGCGSSFELAEPARAAD